MRPINSKILNSGSTSIDFIAKKSTTIALKAFGECESKEFIRVKVPRKLDKYFFIAIGASSNDINSQNTKVITIGWRNFYVRTKQSLNSSSIDNYKSNSFMSDGKIISNFPFGASISYCVLTKSIFELARNFLITSSLQMFFLNGKID